MKEDISKKIESMNKEISNLKSMVIKLVEKKKPEKIIHLRGCLKGMHVSEEDIKEAKKSLFHV